MAKDLKGKRVAILVDNGFEQIELTEPLKALRDAGAEAVIVSPQKDRVKGWQHTKWGDEFDVDVQRIAVCRPVRETPNVFEREPHDP